MDHVKNPIIIDQQYGKPDSAEVIKSYGLCFLTSLVSLIIILKFFCVTYHNSKLFCFTYHNWSPHLISHHYIESYLLII